MTKNNIISYLIIFVIIIGLGLLGLHWHEQDKEQSIRSSISESEGKIKELQKQALVDSLLIKSYTATIDSASKIKHDTLTIYQTKYVQKNNILALGTDASISKLSNNLSH